jgi:serine phosphatase RsbU (regulator of sigma subunit)
MSNSLHVLIVEDSELDAKVLEGLLRVGGYEVTARRVETAEQMNDALNTGLFDVILADYNLPEFNAPDALGLLNKSGRDLPFIVISGGIGEETAVRIMKSGAHDYLMKGNLARLVPAVERELREARDRAAHRDTEATLRAADEQMRVAREIQQRLFPRESPSLDGFDIAGASHPAEETSGDYFDYIPMRNGSLALVVGDVTGHGIGPALLMAEARAYLRILALNLEDIGEILTRANHALAEDIDQERFVTLIMVQLDAAAGTLRYASAGHAACPWLNARGELKCELRRTGIPLGMRAETSYSPSEIMRIDPGDMLALMTDGVEESLSPQQELLGHERIHALLRDNQSKTAAELVKLLHQKAWDHIADLDQQDDYTTIILKAVEKD